MTDREYLDERERGGKKMNEICPTCNGSGGIDVFEDSIGEIVTIPCPDCGGVGEAMNVK
ncbi:hypothetical protein [Caldibacillus debilis]|uniref:hypothetical protein n=1 Tax=Caldibacillus debilis TaxID=301148 RepID=UPI0023F50CDD|nr:hypothetical protein [Caldibacillus debilis]